MGLKLKHFMTKFVLKFNGKENDFANQKKLNISHSKKITITTVSLGKNNMQQDYLQYSTLYPYRPLYLSNFMLNDPVPLISCAK